MKISELAEEAQCSVETIRYYEKEGLLPQPLRASNNYRQYDREHVDRLCFIRNCRTLDMNHSEIRALLALMEQQNSDCSSVNTLLDEHIAHVDVRIAELRVLKKQLNALRESCQQVQRIDACGILQGISDLETEARETKGQRHTHLG